MKNLVVIPLFLGIILGLGSCLDHDVENFQTVTTPAIANNNPEMGGHTLLTWYGEVATPNIGDLTAGECLIAHFTVNYDNQPTDKYLTATDITYNKVEQTFANVVEKVEVGNDFFPIAAVDVFTCPPLFMGKCFFQMRHQASEDQKIAYQLIAPKDSIDERTGANNVYLIAEKLNSAGASSSDIYKNHVFDMTRFFNNFGRDTLVNNEEMKYIRINFNYCYDKKEGNPLFRAVNSTPIEIAVLK